MVDTYGDNTDDRPNKSLDNKSLQGSVESLTKAINSMILLLKTAEKEVTKEQPQQDLSKHFEKLIEQNKDIAKALVLLLEVNREQLPKIAAHTEATSKMIRRPSVQMRRPEIRAEQRMEPRQEQRPRPVMQMPLPPEPKMPGGIFPNIPEAPKQEPRKRGFLGLGR